MSKIFSRIIQNIYELRSDMFVQNIDQLKQIFTRYIMYTKSLYPATKR